jgi:magnesium transporter
MRQFTEKVSRKAGMPPGTLVHIGEKKTERIRIHVVDYDEDNFEERELSSIKECVPYKTKPSVTWINLEGIHQTDVIEQIGNEFDLHPLAQEDILNTQQRPKMDDYEDYLSVILKIISYDSGKLKTEQFSLILGPKFVLSFQEGPGGLFEPLKERLRKGKGRIRKLGPDYLAYALLDAIVDSYFAVLEKIGERIEAMEEQLLTQSGNKVIHAVHHLRRDLIFLRKSVWPLREVVAALERGESSLIQEKTRLFLRDVHDHTVAVIDSVETFRDMVSGMMDVHLSSVSNRLNEVMKVLTIISTIFIPMTFLAGVYGMNFKHMPELEWIMGYPVFWLIIILVGASMISYFKRRNWL